MKYKVKTESELHTRFEKMSDRMLECNKQAFDLAESLGFDTLGVKKMVLKAQKAIEKALL